MLFLLQRSIHMEEAMKKVALMFLMMVLTGCADGAGI